MRVAQLRAHHAARLSELVAAVDAARGARQRRRRRPRAVPARARPAAALFRDGRSDRPSQPPVARRPHRPRTSPPTAPSASPPSAPERLPTPESHDMSAAAKKTSAPERQRRRKATTPSRSRNRSSPPRTRAPMLIGDFAANQAKGGGTSLVADELGIGKAFMEMASKMLANPYKLAETQMNLWADYMNLWQTSTMKLLGAAAEPVAAPKQERQALSPRGLGEVFPVRLHQAGLPHHRALAARDGRERRGPGRRDEAQGGFLHAPVHRRARAVELRADEPRGVPRDDHERRPEPRARAQQPARRHQARQRPAQDLDDRHEGVRARRQHRDHARARSSSRTT